MRSLPIPMLVAAGALLAACSREPTVCNGSDTVSLVRVLVEGVEASTENRASAADFLSVSDFTEKAAASGEIACTAKYLLSKKALGVLSRDKSHAADLAAFRDAITAEYKLKDRGDGEMTVVLTNFDLARAQKLQKLHAAFLTPPAQEKADSPTPEPEDQEPQTQDPTPDPAAAPEATASDVPPPSDQPGNRGHVSTPRTLAATEFYRHLALSDVETAGLYVVPEKRGQGPVSPASADFLNSLREPLRLVDVQPAENDTVVARYSYRTKDDAQCHISARLVFSQRGDEALIESIRTRRSCQ